MNGSMIRSVWILLLFILSTPVALVVGNPAHPGTPQISARQKADFLLSRKLYEKALEAFKSLIKDENADSSLFRGIVKAYQGTGRLDEAETFIKGYLSEHSGSSSAAQYGLGYLFYLEGDDIRAQLRFHIAVRLQEGNALAWNNWGASLSRTKSYTLGVEKVKEAIRLEPSNPMYYNNLRRIYRDMGSAGLFIADYKRYVKDGPRLVAQGYGRLIAKTLRQESFKQYSQGNLDEAIAKFEEIVVIFKETGHQVGLVPIYFGLAVLHEEKGNDEGAEKYYQEVLAINPNHFQAREKLNKLKN
jgi:tetratricopeptide (TPR) repeat protein